MYTSIVHAAEYRIMGSHQPISEQNKMLKINIKHSFEVQ